MPDRANRDVPADYDRHVFINCPFDDRYLPLFRALIFAVFECGLIPRCAQEAYDAGEVRIEKIARIIRDCRWGIHDISRTDLNARGLPRFNMPLELGLFLGARRYGVGRQTRKSCLILDREKFRYQVFISDIAGQDIAAHDDDPLRAIVAVREWLSVSRAAGAHPPGGATICERFKRFTAQLPEICADGGLVPDDLNFVEFADMVSGWLKRELAGGG